MITIYNSIEFASSMFTCAVLVTALMYVWYKYRVSYNQRKTPLVKMKTIILLLSAVVLVILNSPFLMMNSILRKYRGPSANAEVVSDKYVAWKSRNQI